MAVLAGCGTTVPLDQVQASSGGLGAPGGSVPQATTASAPGVVTSSVGGASSAPGGSKRTGVAAEPGSTQVGVARGTTTTTGTAQGAASALPPTGRGWTKTTISIGYVTQNDFNKTVAAAGYSSINAGDQVGDIEAVLAAINKAGGLFGRKVIGVDRDNSSADVSGDPQGTAQSNCDYFKNDKQVIAVLNLQSALDTANFRTCMHKARIPVMSLSIQPITQSILQSLQGYLIPLLTPTYDRLAPVLVSRLTAQKFFTGWDTTNGVSSAAPVKTGLLVTNDNQGKEVEGLLVKALTGAGRTPVVFRYAPTGSQQQSDFQSAVLQFRSAGITHVLADGANLAVFMIQAQSQNYRPRYGISSYSAPQPFLQGLAPASQLVGSMGVGSAPTIDVNAPQDPGGTPGSAYCKKVLADGGQTFSGKRFAEAVAFALCDGLRATVGAAVASGGLTGPEIVRGIASSGPTFPTAFAFVSGLSADNSALPGAGRDLAYGSACSCFAYSGSSYRI